MPFQKTVNVTINFAWHPFEEHTQETITPESSADENVATPEISAEDTPAATLVQVPAFAEMALMMALCIYFTLE